MKKYGVQEAIKEIEKQIEKYKVKALKITTENGLSIAYKIMSSNPRRYYFLEQFEKHDVLITGLKIEQVLNTLDLLDLDNESVIEDTRVIFLKEAIIKYTQLLFCKNSIEDLQKEHDNKEYFENSILIKDLEDIKELTPQVAERYYICPVYFEVHFKDEDETNIHKISAQTYSYYCYCLRDEELEKINI